MPARSCPATIIRRLIDWMRETMHDAPGVGLAAPQVGLPLQLAVIEDSADLQRAIAPERLAARSRRPIPFQPAGGACSKCQSARAVHEPEPLRRKAAAPASPKHQEAPPRFGHDFSNVRVGTGAPLTSQGPPQQPGPGVPGGVAQPAGSGTGSGGTAPATPACEPKGLDRAAFLNTKGATKDALGLTWKAVTYPSVSTKGTKQGGVMVARTTASIKISSVFTRVGSYPEGSERVSEQRAGSCPSRVYPLRLVIEPQGAEKLKEGEQEHCNDFQHAFDTSLKQFADAVNELSNSRRVFQNHKEVENELTRTTGVAPDKWQQ